MEKPKVLVFGGCGFIGRNFVSHLITNNLASYVRVVDKVPPQVAWLNAEHQSSFNSPLVEFKSANLINPESCKAAFATSDESLWDFVVNCAGETKYGQTDPVYNEGILKLSSNCAHEASLQHVKHYVELSSGNMCSSEKSGHKEDGPLEPWTTTAKYKLKVEAELAQIPDLNYTILRLPIVYGVSDRNGLMPRIMGAAVFKQQSKTMKLLWDSSLLLNTVHVEDVCRAIWFVCEREETIKGIYNVVDDGKSTQGSISDLLAELYQINVDYYGYVVSSVVDLNGAAEDVNDKHLTLWAAACRADDIQNTPLSPYMDVELMYSKHLHLDGAKLKQLGFQLNVPQPTMKQIQEIVQDYVRMKVFPHTWAP